MNSSIDNTITDRKPSFVGTAWYLSPEVLEGQPTGPWSDIWAIGCILYKMVFGKTPF